MEQEFEFQEQNSDNVVKIILQRYLPFWPIIIVTTIFISTFGYFYLRFTPKVYQSEGKILVKDDKKGVDASKVLESLDVFGENKIIENEIEVLKSWPLVESVVKKLNLYVTVKFEGRFVDTELYNRDSPIHVIALQPDSITENINQVPFKVDVQKNEITINNSVYKDGQIAKIGGYNFRISLNKKFDFNDQKQYYLTVNPVHAVAKSIIGGLQIQPTTEKSTLITVNLKSTQATKAKDIINTLFDVYQLTSLKDKNLVASNTLNFIDQRLSLITKQLDSVENNIENYKTTTGILDLSEQSRLYLESLKNNDELLNQLNTQLALLSDVEKYLNGKSAKSGMVPSLLGINDVILVGLLTRLYDTELLYSRQEKVNGSKSDVLEQLRGDLTSLRKDILVILVNIRKSLITSKRKIELELNKSQNLISTIPQKEKELLQISRQQAIKNNIYTFLLQKREETAISFKSSVTNSRVIEPAIGNNNVISPVSKNVWLIAVGASGLIFIIIVFIIEQVNNKILFRSEIEKSTKAPIIGELVQSNSEESAIHVKHGSRSLIAEQFKIIRTNLSFYGLKDSAKTILITSSISGEGKSFVAINMATSYALLGKKVALLELDLRKPKIAKKLGINSKYGITHYLTDNATLEEIANPLAEYPNLSVLVSGPIPPNPTELISSTKFEVLISELKEQFDYIIIDSPPIGLVTDAQLLGNFVDTVMYIIRHDYSPQVYLELINTLYIQAKLPNLTLIFNGLKARGTNLYGKYGYGAGYGSDYNSIYYMDVETPKSAYYNIIKKVKRLFS